MRSRIDEALKRHRTRGHDAALSAVALANLRRAADSAADDSISPEEHQAWAARASAGTREALKCLDERSIRYWICRLDVLAWALAADTPVEGWRTGPVKPSLPRRTFRIPLGGPDPKSGVAGIGIAALGAVVIAPSEPPSALLPVASKRDLERGDLKMDDLPVGTVVLRDVDRSLARLDHDRIAGY